MNIRELIEAFEKSQSDLSTIQSNVYGQESGSGKADTSKPNYAGALGPMQILPSTFSGFQKMGVIPKEADINNPADNKAAGDAILGYYHNKYGGDPAKVYAAYYAGPGAINKDGSINTHWRDLKNPKAPTVGQYIDQAMARSKQSPSYVASAGNTLKDKVASTVSNVGSSISDVISKYTPDMASDTTDEIELIINGKRKKFKSKKEAEQALAIAQRQGLTAEIA